MSSPARNVFVFGVYLIGLGVIWAGLMLQASKSA
jgi:hypothetical protein